MTTCKPGIITWNYSGSSANRLLSITNVDDPYSSGNITRQSTTGNSFSVDINAASNNWTWSQVNVSQGWYQGNVPSLSAVSAAFFISNGSDVSCLLGSSSSSSAILDSGEIMGIVLGALAGLGVIVVGVAYYYLRSRRRRLPRGNQRRREDKDNMRRWNSLRSNPSISKSPSESNAGETSTAQSDATELTGESLPNLVEEKVVPSPNHFPPSSYDRRTSLRLQSHSDYSTPSNANHRRRSELHFEQQATRIRSSMESSMHMRTERFSLPAFPRSPPTSPRLSTFPDRERDDYPFSPVDTTFHRGRDEYPPSPFNRGRDEFPSATSTSRSPSASTAARRTPRKPVPHFDLSEPRDAHEGSQDAHPTITSDGVPPPPHNIPVLSDRINFGNTSVHYLIPDMPPPGNE